MDSRGVDTPPVVGQPCVQILDEKPQDQAPAYTMPRMPDGKPLPPVETRFKPGQSGHPGGRKRGSSVLHEIERELAAGAEIGEDGEVIRSGLRAREIAQALLDVASGKRAPDEIDTKAALAILDRTDGAVKRETELSGTLNTVATVRIEGIDDPETAE